MARLPGAGKSIAVVLALVLAAIATYALYAYVQGIEQRAFEDAELVEVFVAQDAIAEGVSASAASEAGFITRRNLPRSAVPEGAVSSLDQIAGLVAQERILADEVLLLARWADPAAIATDMEIPDGFEALSVQVDIPPGVAGFIRAGDRVSVIATVQEPVATTEEPDGTVTEEPGEVLTQYLLQGVEVLAVGQRVTTEAGDDGVSEASDAVLLTVALEPVDAERLVFAIQNASLHFTLLPDGATPQTTPGRTLADLFD